MDGRISRLYDSGDLAGEISLVYTVLLPDNVITAVRGGDGDLKLISWQISINAGTHILNLENKKVKHVTSLRYSQIVGVGLNSWKFAVDDSISIVGDITGINHSEIILRNSSGIGILELIGDNLAFACHTKYEYGTKIGERILEQNDLIYDIMVEKRHKTNLLL